MKLFFLSLIKKIKAIARAWLNRMRYGGTHQEMTPCQARPTPLAIIYKSEYQYLGLCILERPDIETGGQLFGHWTSCGTPVISYVIGPGPNALHKNAFFRQDIDYLELVGQLLHDRFGLHHIGEWHSHHRLGLDSPSSYDIKTMTTCVKRRKLGQSLLLIGTCEDDSASVRPFVCDEERCVGLGFDVIDSASPVRAEIDRALEDLLIHPSFYSRNKTAPHKTKKNYG